MNTNRKEVNYNRRRFLGATAKSFAVAQLGQFSSVAKTNELMSARRADNESRGNASFGPLKQIDAGVLNIGYAEAGPLDGKPVILLHGWPYDIHSFVDVAPILASHGYKVIVPMFGDMALRAFFPARRSVMASHRQSQWTQSR